MAFLDDFKKFAFKGNVVDLAVGVVIGGAFGKIVSALVSDVIMPVVALVMPSGNWRASGLVLRHAEDPKDHVVLNYGDLLGAVFDFFMIAMVLFVLVSKVVKAAEKHIAMGSPIKPAMRDCPFCFESIRADAKRCKACTSQLGSGQEAAV